jgi:hypothetical protein
VGRAIDTAANFSWSRTTEHFFDLYDKLCVRFRNSAGQKHLPLYTAGPLNLPAVNKSTGIDNFLAGSKIGSYDSGKNNL